MFDGSPWRLLPWTGPDGQPCYLHTDNPESRLSMLADDIEEQILAAAELLLDEVTAESRVLRLALRDVVRIAVSRGDRLAEYEE
ncbi:MULTISPECIES: hypothetical protein [Streptomyces]|uniref:Uncharacterized protein n=1 Tax=Streptomyces endophytica TaxID=2991496 RepID=A0ABY6PET5_9ACTN|nr:hypothetical protein [Streptomyces endophytica]UZJ31722.1 hypothetical protein OJ254_17310 [Streptomyces endophytica]